jgi:dolichol-phosphate mannosyltransferase
MNTSGRVDDRRILIFTATYNEADNIVPLCEQLRDVAPNADILVVDDNSPDGTGQVLDRLADGNPRISVIHRPRKLGLGTAHKLAMAHAVLNNYDFLVTMDADFSHQPADVPRLLEKVDDVDFVIGSRYAVGGGSDLRGYRRFVSQSANVAARLLLGIPLTEFTTAFRVFRVGLLRELNLGRIRSQGYSFFLESVFRVHRAGARMREVPIYFAHRLEGESKIPRHEIINGASKLLYLLTARYLGNHAQESSKDRRYGDCPACGSNYLIERSPRRNVRIFVPKRQPSLAYTKEMMTQCLACGAASLRRVRS